MFRRIVLHLAAIQDQNQLHGTPLHWNAAGSFQLMLFQQKAQDLEKEFNVLYNSQDSTYTLSKPTTEPILITNFDPNIYVVKDRAD